MFCKEEARHSLGHTNKCLVSSLHKHLFCKVLHHLMSLACSPSLFGVASYTLLLTATSSTQPSGLTNAKAWVQVHYIDNELQVQRASTVRSVKPDLPDCDVF